MSSAVLDKKGRYSSVQTEENSTKEGRKVEHATPKYACLASGLFWTDYFEKLKSQQKI